MKIRILGNSLRLRLTQSEVRQLSSEGSVRQTIEFGPDSALQYSIKKSAVSQIQSSFANNHIIVEIPNETADNWAQNDVVSLREELSLGENKTLSLLIEKDFKCLTDRPSEDESDMFPNPEEAC